MKVGDWVKVRCGGLATTGWVGQVLPGPGIRVSFPRNPPSIQRYIFWDSLEPVEVVNGHVSGNIHLTQELPP